MVITSALFIKIPSFPPFTTPKDPYSNALAMPISHHHIRMPNASPIYNFDLGH